MMPRRLFDTAFSSLQAFKRFTAPSCQQYFENRCPVLISWTHKPSVQRYGMRSSEGSRRLSTVGEPSSQVTKFRSFRPSKEIDTTVKPTPVKPQIVRTDDGREFAAFDMSIQPKLKPSIVRRRLNRMRIYEGAEKNIRHSPWRLNLVCQMAAGLPLKDALTQLEFCRKSMAPLVHKVLKRTSNLADIRDGLQHSQLEVAECFATHGTPMKRVKPMGRGRTGRMEHNHAHMRVVLREIDFKLRLYQASSLSQKKRWFLLQQEAEQDAALAQKEREELNLLTASKKAAPKAKSS